MRALLFWEKAGYKKTRLVIALHLFQDHFWGMVGCSIFFFPCICIVVVYVSSTIMKIDFIKNNASKQSDLLSIFKLSNLIFQAHFKLADKTLGQTIVKTSVL
jgi:TRAP-type mannitol/chloroaromatic compound transport system permease small subunit